MSGRPSVQTLRGEDGVAQVPVTFIWHALVVVWRFGTTRVYTENELERRRNQMGRLFHEDSIP